MGCHRTTVLRQIQCGYIKATSIFNERNQLVYQIPLSALHPEAQLRYFKEHGHPFPLATEKPASAKAYKPLDHFSAAEREEIRQEMETLERWQEYRRQPGRTAELDAEFVELLRQEDPGRAVSVKTLYRKKKALEENDLAGLAPVTKMYFVMIFLYAPVCVFMRFFEKFLSVRLRSQSSASPVNASAAAPVIYTVSSAQRTVRSPPRRRTVMSASLSAKPFSTAATAAAQAPVPHAHVSPLPRSQTRIFISFFPNTFTNSVFVRSGKIGAFSNSGPIFSAAHSSGSENTTQCGFPIEI